MNYNEAVEVFTKLFENRMSEDEAKELLVELYKKGESAEEIAAAAKVMREHSIKLKVDDSLKDKLIDVVGTGGDKSGSFNISSTVAILIASLGCFVAKHGNRAITSNAGSADMLEAIGINLNLTIPQQEKMLEESGFVFMFAINHHPAMKHIMPIRKSLKHRTIFNILGPLTNPAGVSKYLLGVFDKKYIDKITDALLLLDTKNSMIVSSHDGLDEISISDITYYNLIKEGKIEKGELNPMNYGFGLYPFEAIKGGDATKNAQITKEILQGKRKGAMRDIVLLNAAAALVVEGFARDIKEGVEMSEEAIDSGKALKKLEQIIKVSNTI